MHGRSVELESPIEGRFGSQAAGQYGCRLVTADRSSAQHGATPDNELFYMRSKGKDLGSRKKESTHAK
jgi:hypothetical protein